MEVRDYIDSRPDLRQGEVLRVLHELCLSFPGVAAKLRYGIPFYDRKSWLCYANPLKNGAVAFCFVRANELSNEQGLLVFEKRKQVACITLTDARDIPREVLSEIIQEALLLDEHVPYRTKNAGGKGR